MKIWIAALVATLGLCTVECRAAEPLKTPPAPVEKAESAPVSAGPVGPACGSCCKTSCPSCFSGRLLAWLMYRPTPTDCCIRTGPRPTQAYVYFLVDPCHEGPGNGCGAPGCGSCAKH